MKKNHKIVLFDIDYTIFNADKFREEIYSSLAELFGKTYDEAFIELTKQAESYAKKIVGYYDPKTFLLFLKKETHSPVSLEELERILWDDKKIASCLYDDVEDVLQALSKNEDILLGTLSTGETYFQSKKIEILESFFEKEYIHIFANKVENLFQTIQKYESQKLFIVDDLPQILSEAKLISKSVTTILMKRMKKHEKHEDKITMQPDFVISDLSELLSIVNK